MSQITVTLNQAPLKDLNISGETSLTDAIALAQSSLPAHEVIHQIIIDDQHCDLATADELENIPLGQISTLQFFSQEVDAIAAEGLQDLQEAIAHCETRLSTSARSFRLGQVDDGGGAFLEGASLLHDVLQFFTALGQQRGIKDQDPIARRFHKQEAAMVQTFQELEKAQQASDWNLLADLIQYELTPI